MSVVELLLFPFLFVFILFVHDIEPHTVFVMLSFVGKDVLDMYKTLGRVPLGTRVRTLRNGRTYCLDLLTGRLDNPVGFAVPYEYVLGRCHVQGSCTGSRWYYMDGLPPSVREGGAMHNVAKWLVNQTGPQCYLAAAVNVLFSVASVRAVLEETLELVRRNMPDVYSQYIVAGVFPSSVAVPAGLAFLQMYAFLRGRAEFDITPVLEVLEMRLRQRPGDGGHPADAFCEIAKALGFSFQLHASGLIFKTVTAGRDFVVCDEVDIRKHTFVEVTPCAHSVLVGGFLYVHGQEHVVAALAGGLVYDSMHLGPEKLLWESKKLSLRRFADTHAVGFASRALVAADFARVQSCARACLSAIFEHVPPMPKRWRAASSLLLPIRGSRGVFLDIRFAKESLKVIWFLKGVPTHEVRFGPGKRTMVIFWQQASVHCPFRACFQWGPEFARLRCVQVGARDHGSNYSMERFLKTHPGVLDFLAAMPMSVLFQYQVTRVMIRPFKRLMAKCCHRRLQQV
jgi:hypothetical protein